MLKHEGNVLLDESEELTLKVTESVGAEKCRRALQEVADDMEEAEDYRPLLDRAYEIGYRPSWDGTVDFCPKGQALGLVLGGMPQASIIDVDSAMSDEEAVRQGYLDEAALIMPKDSEEYEAENVDLESDGSIQPMSSAWVQYAPGGGLTEGLHYRWYNFYHNHIYGWSVLGGRPHSASSVLRHIYIRRYNYRLNTSNILNAYELRARTRYLSGGSSYYSNFRFGRFAGYQVHSFNSGVVGRAAEMWRSTWRTV